MTGPPTTARPARPVTPVGILADRLDRLCARVGDDADPDVVAGLRAARDLAVGLDPYVERCTTPESPALAALAARTRTHDWVGRDAGAGAPALEQEMLSGHVEGRALAFLVAMTGARRVLDVGMFTGYSALAMAEALPDGGDVVACEVDAPVAAFARESFAASPAGDRIRVEVGPARDTLDGLARAGERFDLVFVDADKAGYGDYLDVVLGAGPDDGLLAAGGTVAVDNTLLQGEPWLPATPSANGAAIAAFNEAVAADPRVEQVLVPLRDGLTLIRRA